MFAAIGEAMAELRAGRSGSALEQRREAHMRQVLRATLKETAGTVAVVCGAWHVPALTAPLPSAAERRRVAARHPQAQGGARLGAVDALPAGVRLRLRRRDHLAGLVSAPVHRA